jgi:hypothetical protein
MTAIKKRSPLSTPAIKVIECAWKSVTVNSILL